MTLGFKNTLAILSFLAIGFLVYPMIATTDWSELNVPSSGYASQPSADTPIDWRALIAK